MIHDFATVKRTNTNVVVDKNRRKPKPLAVATIVSMFALGGVGVSQVVLAVAEDIKASAAEIAAAKKAERARKAELKAEKQRLADEKRDARRIAQAKALAEKQGGFDFYEKLSGDSWSVPLAADAYGAQSIAMLQSFATNTADTKIASYSLQTSIHRQLAEARLVADQISALGMTPHISEAKVKAGGLVYRVTVGPFSSLEDASAAREVLNSKQYFASIFKE